MLTSTKVFSTFIQTDKAIYKPSDVLQYRILAIDFNTKPIQPKKVTVKITDPGSNEIQKIENIKFEKGIYQSKLEISKAPPLGMWKISVDDGSEEVI